MADTPVILQDILTILNQTAPSALAASWDNVGLMVGDPFQEVTGILVGLDPTSGLIDEAIAHGANLVINHHPLIFTPLQSIRTDQPIGRCIAEAIKNRIAIVACHTNLDVVHNGVNHVLARQIGLQDTTPLAPTSATDSQIGFGSVGSLPAPLAAGDFFGHLCQVLGLTVLPICGVVPSHIQKVAVCGGSGSDFAEAAYLGGAQVYITGEVKHNVARWAEESGFCIIDAGHFATENLVVDSLVTTLAKSLREGAIELKVQASNLQNNPFFYYMKSK